MLHGQVSSLCGSINRIGPVYAGFVMRLECGSMHQALKLES